MSRLSHSENSDRNEYPKSRITQGNRHEHRQKPLLCIVSREVLKHALTATKARMGMGRITVFTIAGVGCFSIYEFYCKKITGVLEFLAIIRFINNKCKIFSQQRTN